jgi:predicted phosphodiesterase
MFKKTQLLIFFLLILNICEAYKFAQISDTHIEIGEKSVTDSEMRLSLSVNLLENAVIDINANDEIEFVLITGDLLNNGRSWNLDSAKFILDKLEKPYYVVLGNNDFAFPTSGIGISKTTFHTAFAENEPNLSSGVWYDSHLQDVLLMGIDNINPISGAEAWTDKKLKLIEKLLSENSEKDIIILLHYPVTELDYTDNGELMNNSKDFVELCQKYKTDVICSGHYHYGETQQKEEMLITVSPALIEYPHEYLIYDIQVNNIKISSKSIAEAYISEESKTKMNQRVKKLMYIYDDISEEQIYKKIIFEEVNYGRR